MQSVPFVLFAIFLILKLTGVIMWSWWWVTSPLWISALLVLLLFIFGASWLVGMSKTSKR